MNNLVLEEAQKELEKIEHNNRTYRSDFARQMAIFEDIVIHINSRYKSKEKKHWHLVMDLYKEKYNNL